MMHEYIGKRYVFNYGDFIAINEFFEEEVAVEIKKGSIQWYFGIIKYSSQELSSRIHLISWREPDGTSAAHVNDFLKMQSYGYFNFLNMQTSLVSGTITPLTLTEQS